MFKSKRIKQLEEKIKRLEDLLAAFNSDTMEIEQQILKRLKSIEHILTKRK